MIDTVVKGVGTSRTIKTTTTLPSTYDEFRSQFISPGIPIDLGPLNVGGVNVMGTSLNKANLLTDATESAIWGSVANRTVNQALAQLRTIIANEKSELNTALNGKARVVTGTYKGTYKDVNTEQTIVLGGKPKLFLTQGPGKFLTNVGNTNSHGLGIAFGTYIWIFQIRNMVNTSQWGYTWQQNNVTMTTTGITLSNEFLIASGITYQYLAIL